MNSSKALRSPYLPVSASSPGRLALLILLMGVCWLVAFPAHAQPASQESDNAADQAALIEKGRYLATAADCTACHTMPDGGKPFAGGYNIISPLGAIRATNITPSTSAGIGHYSEAQFARALRQGIRADGAHLYPAMPYTAYAQLTDEDVHALYTYFMHGVEPVDEQVTATELPFPYNIRTTMAVWNMLFLDDGPFEPDPSQSEQVNRGAYLVKGPAHCGTCHTPRNMLMAEDESQFLGGSELGAWYAPNITSDEVSGTGGWSDAELIQFLRTGHVEGKSQAGGQMAEAIENSFQHLKEEDITAIVAYLRTVPAIRNEGQTQPAYARGEAHDLEPQWRGQAGHSEQDSLDSGAALFSANCASCHQPDGGGSQQQRYPELFHNTATGSPDASNLIAAIVYGVERNVGDTEVFMPHFSEGSRVNTLSNEEVADISNYVLDQYGNAQLQVTSADVAQAREGGPQPLLAKVQPFVIWIVIAMAVLIVALIVFATYRHRQRRRNTRA
ncbi:c-type cytochrome [Halomonas sp. WWR20]